jgi:hypothetical protein
MQVKKVSAYTSGGGIRRETRYWKAIQPLGRELVQGQGQGLIALKRNSQKVFFQ